MSPGVQTTDSGPGMQSAVSDFHVCSGVLEKSTALLKSKGYLGFPSYLSKLQQEKCLLSRSIFMSLAFRIMGCFGHSSLILSVLKIINGLQIPKRDEKNSQTCGVYYTCFQISPMIRKENYRAEDLISSTQPSVISLNYSKSFQDTQHSRQGIIPSVKSPRWMLISKEFCRSLT